MKKHNIETFLHLVADHESFAGSEDDLLSSVVGDVLSRYPVSESVSDELSEEELEQVFAAGKPLHLSSRKHN